MSEISAKSIYYEVGGFSLEIDSFSAVPQKINVLIGPNGAGKSTLMRILAGVLPTHSGSVFINGTSLEEINGFERACKVSFLPQNDDVLFNLTVFDLIGLGRIPLQKLGQTGPKKDKEKIEQIAHRLGCQHLLERNYSLLSGGERRLVRLASSLVIEPEILLIDEPFNHLDITHQALLLEILRQEAREGMTIIAIIHDLNIILNWAENIAIIKEGKIAQNNILPQNIDGDILSDAYGMQIKIHEISGQKFASFI